MRSLRFKIISPFLLGSFVLTLFLGWYTYRSTQQAVTESVLLISQAQTNTIYSSMSLLFRSMSTSAEKMTTDPHVVSLFSENKHDTSSTETDSWFDLLIHGNEYYRNIFIVNAQGVCIASNSQMQIGISYANRAHVKAALQGEVVIRDVSVGQITRTLTATIATPVHVDGELVGALVLVNDFADVVQYEGVASQGIQSVFTALLAPGGELMAHRESALVEGAQRFPDLYAFLVEASQYGGAVEYELAGQRYKGYAKREPITGWMIISSGLQSELFSPADKSSMIVLGISFFVLCVIAFIVIHVVNGVLDSLISLIAYAKLVSEGNFTATLVDTSRNDELGILHQALQVMVQSMRKMLAQSQEASKLKSEFLANMSHEIRTPLNAVIGMAHLYMRSEEPVEKKCDYVVKIQVAAKSLLGIINNILDTMLSG